MPRVNPSDEIDTVAYAASFMKGRDSVEESVMHLGTTLVEFEFGLDPQSRGELRNCRLRWHCLTAVAKGHQGCSEDWARPLADLKARIPRFINKNEHSTLISDEI